MKTSELDFNLPEKLIADHPASPRDAARLMVLDRKSSQIGEDIFRNLDQYLNPGDVLVLNETKVFPARSHATTEKGKQIEVVFLSEKTTKNWEVLIGGRTKDGEIIDFGHGLQGIIKKNMDGQSAEVNLEQKAVYDWLEKYGEMPLPPYLGRKATPRDKTEYQTVFAHQIGSAAAPTAGLHFTDRLLKKLRDKGVQIEYVTLHVGLGTFAPVRTERLEDHPIHAEHYEIGSNTAERLNLARSEGRRIIACGTTVMRTLESASDHAGHLKSGKSSTELFIYPGYSFRLVNGLITNFHTPRSSLLALVMAFASQDLINAAYQRAIEGEWRFFSYGDGMLII